MRYQDFSHETGCAGNEDGSALVEVDDRRIQDFHRRFTILHRLGLHVAEIKFLKGYVKVTKTS